MKLNGTGMRPLWGAAAVATLLVLGAQDAQAQPNSPTPAPSPASVIVKLPDTVIAQFKADPQSLLTTYASAGLPLSTRVRGLVLTDPSLVATLIELAKNANDAQKGAIGAGLAEAAQLSAATDPKLAAQIQQAVAQSGLAPLITAFIGLSNGTITAATGAGGGAGSGGPTGGLGSLGGANTGSNAGTASFGQVNSASAFGSLGAGAVGGGLTTSTSLSTSPATP
jgi:hypothetical protein